MSISSQCAGVPPLCRKCAGAHCLYLPVSVCRCAAPLRGGGTHGTHRGQIADQSKLVECADFSGAES